MQASNRFFSNRDCQYYPCHEKPDPDQFNCLFCFCPLYSLGSDCGGDFVLTDKGVKNCRYCVLPHQADYYDVIMARLKEEYQ
jgi:Zn-finger protein